MVYGDDRLALIGLVAAILGHSFSVFLKFRGGKGVATTIGGLLALMCPVVLIGLVVWLIIFYTKKIVALASIFFAVSLPISAYFIYDTEEPRFYLSAALALFIVFAIALTLSACSPVMRISSESNLIDRYKAYNSKFHMSSPMILFFKTGIEY